jgi:hypothetical protein
MIYFSSANPDVSTKSHKVMFLIGLYSYILLYMLVSLVFCVDIFSDLLAFHRFNEVFFP